MIRTKRFKGLDVSEIYIFKAKLLLQAEQTRDEREEVSRNDAAM